LSIYFQVQLRSQHTSRQIERFESAQLTFNLIAPHWPPPFFDGASHSRYGNEAGENGSSAQQNCGANTGLAATLN
jgi:hypothetical protein